MSFTPVLGPSIHGKAFGLNTSGLPVMGGRGDSTMYGMVARTSADVVIDSSEMAFAANYQTGRSLSCSATSIEGYGFISLTSAAVAIGAIVLDVENPLFGRECVIHVDCSATQMSLGASSSLRAARRRRSPSANAAAM